MIKYYCDNCGEETKRNYVGDRLKGEDIDTRISYELVLAYDKVWNGGVLCSRCIIKVLRRIISMLLGEAPKPIIEEIKDGKV